MRLVLDLALFLGVTLGLALPVIARLPTWEPVLRLAMGLAASVLLSAAAMFAVYAMNLPRELLWALPALAVSILVFHRPTLRTFLRDPELRAALLAWLAVAAGCVFAQALVVSYAGGGWAGDWVEHYDRVTFFVKDWPADTRFIGAYTLPSRPPIANLAVAAFESIAGTGIAHYQVFATLLSSLAFVPALALAWRFDRGGRRIRTAVMLAALFLASPVWMENATFPWTKLPAAFFALLGLVLVMPAGERPAEGWRSRVGWLMLAVGFLVHYSIGPWIVAIIVGIALHRRAEWRSRTFWREHLLVGLACGALIFLCLSWSAGHYGWKETLGSNTAVAGSAPSASGQLHTDAGNLYRTIVPHFFRSFNKGLISQENQLGLIRDQFFNLYQVNLLFLCGSGGLAAIAWLLTRGERRRSPAAVFWVATICTAVVVGIGVHSPPDSWGLAHICLQPLALLGLALVAAGFDEMPALLRRVVVALLAVDFALGVALHFLLQSFALAPAPLSEATDVAFASTLDFSAKVNLLWKHNRALAFLGDYARPYQGLSAAAFAFILLWLLALLRRPAAEAAGSPQASRRTLPPWLGTALVAAVGALVAVTAVQLLRSTYMMYDDEGYVLYSLKSFSEHGGLYDRVFSQYGPFYYVFFDLVHRLGWEIGNSGARLLNFFEWLGACALCTGLAWRSTRSHLASAAVLAVTFVFLWPMISEPSHPGGFICLLVAAAAFVGTHFLERPRTVAVLLGGTAAALLLTKVNVGVFLIAGAGAWWLLNAATPLPTRTVRTLLGALLFAMPWVLMRSLLPEGWVLRFALIVSCSACALLAIEGEPEERRLPLGTAAWGLAALAAVAAGTIVAVMLRGTTARGLLDGVLLDPLRMPLNYTGPVNWRTGAAAAAIGSLALAFVTPRLPERGRFWLVVAGRLVAGAAFLLSWANLLPLNDHAFAMNFGLASAWFFVAPLRRPDPGMAARLWLALLLIPQSMHAFPVAGSQISWGTFLWIPLAAAGLWDAGARLRERRPSLARPFFVASSFVGGAIVVGMVFSFSRMAQNRASEGEELGLPGAERLFLPENFTSALRVLTRNASAHADVLFSLPGMYSFNLWTGVPTPTLQNATHWFTLLSAQKQAEIGRALLASPRSCVIVQRSVYDFLRGRDVATESALTALIKRDFEPAFSLGTYEFWVRRGRTVAGLGTVRVLQGADPAEPRFKVEITLAQSRLQGVAAVDFRLFEGATSRLLHRWDAANARVFVTPLGSDGKARGPSTEVHFPFSASGLFRVDLLVNDYPRKILADNSILYLVDAEGHRLTEARFVY